MTAMLVTGYVHIPDHPRPHEEYNALMDKLLDVTDLLERSMYFAQYSLADCWMTKYLAWMGITPTHSVADNPAKNSLMYHVVQHEKIMMMLRAANHNNDQAKGVETFAWVDMGIHSVPGVTNEIIADAVKAAANEKAIVIPGCWDMQRANACPDSQVNWRFCGGFLVVPRRYLLEFELAFRAEAIRHIRATNNVSWEVNTLQRLERANELPIWHYYADHNETLFTNYPRMPNGHHPS